MRSSIRSADHVIDMDGGGKSGGCVVAEGDPSALFGIPHR
jgi:excinuclease UvrABC ATPase subunit